MSSWPPTQPPVPDVPPAQAPPPQPEPATAAPDVPDAPPAPEPPPQPEPATVAPGGADAILTGLSIEARRYGDQGRWVFGVNVDGAFVAFADRKLGAVDDDLREAREPGFRETRAATHRREILGL